MPAYRYLLCDLLTDQLLAVLPLTGVQFDRRISRVGSLSATMEAPTPELVETARLLHRYAGRSALWVLRDQALWWGGIPWTVQVKQGPRGPVTATIAAATFDSYAHRRQLYADKAYVNEDQGHIIPDLWRTIQDDPSGDIGVVAEDVTTGVLRDRTYKVSEQSYVGKLIEELGDVIDGPEHTIDVYLDASSNRVKRLRLASRLGLTEPRAVFQRTAKGGGRVTEWELTADAVDGGTSFQTRGDSMQSDVGTEQEPLLSARVQRDDLLTAGWPLLDVALDYSGVIEQATLDDYATSLSQTNGGAMPVSGYTVEVGNTGWSPNRIGDAVRIKMLDAWHTPASDTVVRPVGCVVQPPTNESPETVQLLLEDED